MHIIVYFGVPIALYLIKIRSGSPKFMHMLGTLIWFPDLYIQLTMLNC